jgi:cbb3-type cytochrome oxidase subunit 1
MAATTARVMGLALRYAKTSVLYLAAGSTLVLLTFAGLLQFSMFAFYFMELYGFVAMMIFGVSYLMVPAFAHRPLHNANLANYQYWLFNIGTLGLTLGFSGLVQGDWLKSLQITSFLVQVAALYIHAYNIWRTASGWKGSPGETLVRMGQ